MNKRSDDIERLAKFMGWEFTPWPWQKGKPKTGYRFNERGECWRIFNVGHSNDVLWDPLTRLDDAMMVADKIGSGNSIDAWMFTLMNWSYYGDKSYTAEFFNSHLEKKAKGTDKTLPGAIAIAALAYLDAIGKRQPPCGICQKGPFKNVREFMTHKCSPERKP